MGIIETMKTTEPELRDIARRKKSKRTETSLWLPILGIVLLVSPLANAFTRPDGSSGVFFCLSMSLAFGLR